MKNSKQDMTLARPRKAARSRRSIAPAYRLLLVAACCLLLFPWPSQAAPAPSKDCRGLALLQADQAAGRYKIQYDEGVFWDRLGYAYKAGYRSTQLARYIWASEGGLDPALQPVTPIRTGREVALYQELKQYISKGGHLLSPEDILQLSMRAVRDANRDANLQLAMLTAHNVMRVLARPEQWVVGTDPNDAMAPVFDDLRNKSSTGSGPTLPQMLKNNYGLGDRAIRDPNAWVQDMFQSGGRIQVFQSMISTTNRENNGGSHYYYWVGALGQTMSSGLTRAALKSEKNVKEAQGLNEHIRIQNLNGRKGRALTNCLETGINNVSPPTPGQTPQPPPKGRIGGLFPKLEALNRLMENCEYEAALEATKFIATYYPDETAWLDIERSDLLKLERQARAQSKARALLKEAQTSIQAKDLAKAIPLLDRARHATDLPKCMHDKIHTLQKELQLRKDFSDLTKKVSEANNEKCDFKLAAQHVGKITNLSPREQYITDWLNENLPILSDLQEREKKAKALLDQARIAAATAKTDEEWDKAIELAQQAHDTAPKCVRKQMDFAKLIAEWQKLKNPPINASIVLLLDTSGSMGDNNKIVQAKGAARAAVRKATRSTEMAVLAFSGSCSGGSTSVVHGFSTDANTLLTSIDKLSPGGGTPMYIAVGVAVKYAQDYGRGKNRLVVLMSDGGDTCRDQMKQAAGGISQMNIRVNTIGFDIKNNKQAQEDLKKLSQITNGRSLSASAADPKEIIRAFDLAMLPSLLKDFDNIVMGSPSSSYAAAYFDRAKSFVEQQDLAGALSEFKQAYKAAPQSPAVNYNLSLLHEANDQLISAVDHAQKYLDLAPAAFDSVDVKNRIHNLQDELKRNPRVVLDPAGCRDVYIWANREKKQAKKNPTRRQAILEISIAAQRGDCEKARNLAQKYKQAYH
ncbi:VWA domain-containing protein [Acidobacteriota bacterium]